MIKAAFFDIDGTLVSLKTKVYPQSAADAVAALRKNGIKCFVATGRSKFEIAEEHLLDGIEFDGYRPKNQKETQDFPNIKVISDESPVNHGQNHAATQEIERIVCNTSAPQRFDGKEHNQIASYGIYKRKDKRKRRYSQLALVIEK